MTRAQTYSWIFYSIALASEVEAASFRAIEGIADGINHAVPTQKEMRNSISWLTARGLIERVEGSYALTQEGRLAFENLPSSAKTALAVWEALKKQLVSLGADDVTEIDPNSFVT